MKAPNTRRRHVYIIGGFAFLPHPTHRGVWLRVERCVLFVECPYSGCGAKAGELCNLRTGPSLSTHYVRRISHHQKLNIEQVSLEIAKKLALVVHLATINTVIK